MALKATIHKAAINIADMDRNFFQDINLTIAQHPSETDQRMMLRLLAWICHADERLLFTKGLSADDEPEVWRHNDHNGIELWIELGLPEEKRLRKACNQSKQVVLYAYSERAAKVWWPQVQEKLAGHRNLRVRFLDDEQMAKWLRCLTAICHYRRHCKKGLSGYQMYRIIWKLVLPNGKTTGNKCVDYL